MSRLSRPVEKLLRKERKVFFVGAGISRDPPANLPTANELSAKLVEIVAGTDRLLRNSTGQICDGIYRGIPVYRLEMLLEIARQGIGNSAVKIMGVCDAGTPNSYHYGLARALRAGHTVVTTNVDSLIEAAYLQLYGARPPLRIVTTEAQCLRKAKEILRDRRVLFKIHGSLKGQAGNTTYRSIQATVASMANGLTSGKRRILATFLDESCVVVFGYSGRDDFDLAPALRSLLGTSRLIWVKHEDRPFVVSRPKASFFRKKIDSRLSGLLKSAVDSWLISGRTFDVVSRIRFFRFARPRTAPIGIAGRWENQLERVLDSFRIPPSCRCRYIGKLLQFGGKLSEAKACLERSALLSTGIERAIALDDLAQCHFLMRDFPTDLKYRRKARSNACRVRSIQAQNLIARTWLGAGECFRNRAIYGRALTCFGRAAKIYLHLQQWQKVGCCLAGAGGVYRMTSRFSEAKWRYLSAVRYSRKGKDLSVTLFAKWGLAELAKYAGSFSEALRMTEDIYTAAESIGSHGLMGWSLWSRAEILRLQGKITVAWGLYDDALSVFSSADIAGRSWALEGRAQCKAIQGICPLADLEIAETGFRSLGAKVGDWSVSLDRVLFFTQQGDRRNAEKAFARCRQGSSLKDRAFYLLIAGEVALLRNGIHAGRLFHGAAVILQRLKMKHACVATSVLSLGCSIALGGFYLTREKARRLLAEKENFHQKGYFAEAAAVEQALLGRRPQYTLPIY